MPAPFPYDAFAGGVSDPIERVLPSLLSAYSWLARIADELNAEGELNLKRVNDLVEFSHQYRRGLDLVQMHIQARLGKTAKELEEQFAAVHAERPQEIAMAVDYAATRQDSDAVANIAGTVRSLFAMKKCTWASIAAMNADFQRIYNAATLISEWIEANETAYKDGFTIVKPVARGVMTDDPIKTAKSPAVAARIAEFRALFGPSPAASKG